MVFLTCSFTWLSSAWEMLGIRGTLGCCFSPAFGDGPVGTWSRWPCLTVFPPRSAQQGFLCRCFWWSPWQAGRGQMRDLSLVWRQRRLLSPGFTQKSRNHQLSEMFERRPTPQQNFEFYRRTGFWGLHETSIIYQFESSKSSKIL